jgi:hypothetical protein
MMTCSIIISAKVLSMTFILSCIANVFLNLLYIPRSVLKKHLIPKDYYKPKIEIRNYYLKWNNESCGIPQKEINELKKFLTNAISFFDTSYELLNSFEKPKYKDKYRLYKELSLNIHISYASKHSSHNIVRYELHMHPDSPKFIDRIEGIEPITTTETTYQYPICYRSM